MQHARWTKEREDRARKMCAEGASACAMAKEFGLSDDAVLQKLGRMGLKTAKQMTAGIWNDERRKRLDELWSTGHSGNECARILTTEFGFTVSKNMAIGQIHRHSKRRGAQATAATRTILKPPKKLAQFKPPGVMSTTEAARIVGISQDAFRQFCARQGDVRKGERGWIVTAEIIARYQAQRAAYDPRSNLGAAPKAAVKPVLTVVPPAPPPEPDISGALPLWELGACQCHWPVNSWSMGEGVTALFCATETDGATYCTAHKAKAFTVSTKPLKRSSIRDSGVYRKSSSGPAEAPMVGIDGRLVA